LENGAIASEKKDFVSQAETSEEKRDPLKSPQNEKEYMAAFHALRKENEDLKNQLNIMEVKLRQLELQK
jgi:DnaJ-domain-containing protein 1